ncbi:testis-specific serine/threonine-protein kinase 5-like [Lytechinus variegatus]|uniref:testis-specific serine/threonine-protein kinase 5-like n=1 Tax=Lytechinus variegatus TaxID=7654 RepID=UPI001BB0E0C1|nr:testis-specific serine/threonine-protein kinase 5-like [Lytechinus variegatus]
MAMDHSIIETADCRRHGYILTDKTLGSGTFAKVKLARVMEKKISQTPKLRDDLRTKGHNMVAIKIISKRDAPSEYLKKFMPREIDSMRITHKHAHLVSHHLIQLYEFFRSERGVYLVLEYAANGDVLSYINDSVIETGMAVQEDKARQLFRQIVSGVTFCHDRNVVHRSNFLALILPSPLIFSSDFGFACRFPSNRCNMLSTFCGSYAYAAPEILAAKNYDGKLADVWSLGIILYALVNGRLPFNDQNLNTLMDQTKKKVKFQPWVSKVT